jgi:hypothetical protein
VCVVGKLTAERFVGSRYLPELQDSLLAVVLRLGRNQLRLDLGLVTEVHAERGQVLPA